MMLCLISLSFSGCSPRRLQSGRFYVVMTLLVDITDHFFEAEFHLPVHFSTYPHYGILCQRSLAC